MHCLRTTTEAALQVEVSADPPPAPCSQTWLAPPFDRVWANNFLVWFFFCAVAIGDLFTEEFHHGGRAIHSPRRH